MPTLNNSPFTIDCKNTHSNYIFKSIIDNIPIGVMVLDNNFNITLFNPIQESITKISSENVIGRSFFDIFPYIFNDKIKIRLRNIFSTRETIILNEFPFYTSKSEKEYIYVNIKINLLDTVEGVPNSILFTIEDCKKLNVTKEKENENLLQESESYYRKLIEFLPAAIFVHVDGKVIFCNTAMIKLLGLNSADELINKRIVSFISPEYHELVNHRMELVQKHGQFAPLVEQKFIRADGTEIYIQVTSGRFPYKGIMASLSVAQDISEHKKAVELQEEIAENNRLLSEAREFDKLKTEFFANISHELRTPLNVILGAIQLLSYYNRDWKISEEKSKQYLNSIKQNCFRLLRLVNNLIDITKMDSGYFEINPSNHNIVNIVENISLSVAEYIENKNINLIFDTDVEEKFMSCDPDKIERIMLNLISNSIKFTNPDGSIFINMYDKGDYVIISVRDTGIGIPSDKLPIIFERFRQVDKSLARNHEGSGIGLSLVKSLVEMHGGEISVKSNYGEGSEFIIKLPTSPIYDTKSCIEDKPLEQLSVERITVEFSDIYS